MTGDDIERLLGKLGLPEKIRLLTGSGTWRAAGASTSSSPPPSTCTAARSAAGTSSASRRTRS